MATPETHTRAANVAVASARSARRLLSLEGRFVSLFGHCAVRVLGRGLVEVNATS